MEILTGILLLLFTTKLVVSVYWVFAPTSVLPSWARPSEEDSSPEPWSLHLVPELLYIVFANQEKALVYTKTDEPNAFPVSSRTSTGDLADDPLAEFGIPSYFNHIESVRHGGVIMEEKPAGFTLLEQKPWVPADLNCRDGHSQCTRINMYIRTSVSGGFTWSDKRKPERMIYKNETNAHESQENSHFAFSQPRLEQSWKSPLR
ncbi:hypothetical protein LB507_000497, partial [Fusarium sp. FIESC RH6]